MSRLSECSQEKATIALICGAESEGGGGRHGLVKAVEKTSWPGSQYWARGAAFIRLKDDSGRGGMSRSSPAGRCAPCGLVSR